MSNLRWEHVSDVPVDAGCVIVSDPCYILPDKRSQDHTGLDYENVMGDDNEFYSKPIVLIPASGIGGIATLIQRFGGDGVYPLYAKIDKNNMVSAIMIDFAGEEV